MLIDLHSHLLPNIDDGSKSLRASIIFNSILNAILTFLLITTVSGVKLTKKFDLNPLKKVWGFSKNQFGFNFINYFSRNSDSLLIGRLMSSEALGNYNKSYQLLMYPVTIFGGVVTPILQPVLSNYQDNPEAVREVYFKIIKVLAILTIPFSFFLMFSAKQIILIMFGSQWQEAVKPFSILSSTLWIQVISSTAGAIFQARNKTKDLFLTGILSAVILVMAITIGVVLGTIQTVSVCLSIAFFGNFIQSYWFLTHRVLDSNLFQFFKLFVNPIFLGVIMFGTFSLYNYFAGNFFSSTLIDLLVRIILFISVFIIAVLSCGEYNTLVNLIIKRKS